MVLKTDELKRTWAAWLDGDWREWPEDMEATMSVELSRQVKQSSPMLDYEHWARSWSGFLGSQPAGDLISMHQKRISKHHLPMTNTWLAWTHKTAQKHVYPATVRQSGSSMSCASDVTISVVSVPSEPCTRTIADSLSMHCAATHAPVSASLTCDNQPHESRRDSHLSLEVLTS